MRSMDIDVAEWAHVRDSGRWIRFRAPGVQVVVELYLTGVASGTPVHLSMQAAPPLNCSSCVPFDEDPTDLVVAFARRPEYSGDGTSVALRRMADKCATVVPAMLQTTALVGSTIALRQQPANKACAFDVFLWLPKTPRAGIHVPLVRPIHMPVPTGSLGVPCGGDVGVLPGSSSLDGFRGTVQRSVVCARYDLTVGKVEDESLNSVETPVCPAECVPTAPARDDVDGRGVRYGASSGLEDAYQDVLSALRGDGNVSTRTGSPTGTLASAIAFERMLSQGTRASCCAGFTCDAMNRCSEARQDTNMTASSPNSSPTSSPTASPSSHPPRRKW